VRGCKEIDELIRGWTQIPDAAARGQRNGVEQNSGGAREWHFYFLNED
jgi:hypothetical protein